MPYSHPETLIRFRSLLKLGERRSTRSSTGSSKLNPTAIRTDLPLNFHPPAIRVTAVHDMTDRQLQCLLEQNGNRTDLDAGDRADLAAMREELVQRGAQGTRCYCG